METIGPTTATAGLTPKPSSHIHTFLRSPILTLLNFASFAALA